MSKTKTRTTYSKEFKLDVIARSNRCDSIKELADDLGLQDQRIYRWRSEYKADPERSFPGNGVEKQSPEEKKIAVLQTELDDVKMQRDILKKPWASSPAETPNFPIYGQA